MNPKNTSFRRKALRALLFAASLMTEACFAQSALFDWTSTDIQALYGHGFVLGESKISTITLEHADGWKYGDNFFFVDLYQRWKPNGINVEAYGEWYSHLSLKKTTGWSPPLPGLKDILLSGGVNAGSKPADSPFLAYLGGIRFDFSAPRFDYLQLYVHAYKNDQNLHTGMQITPVWSVPFTVGEQRFKFRGFMDFSTSQTGAGSWHWLAQPQLLFDVGALQGTPDKLMVGCELWYWKNKYGVKGKTDVAPQVALYYAF